MNKRDNEFVERILELADEHFSREDTLSNLDAAVAAKLAEAESAAIASGDPFDRTNSRWAIRRVLFRPNLWSGLSAGHGAMRRAALERLLILCKGAEKPYRAPYPIQKP